jgi:hypothetical protein
MPAMGFTVTDIQPTPNPNAAKFILDGEISENPISFLNPAEGENHPIASQLFSIKGVTSVLLLGSFVTVNKEDGAKWEPISRKVREILQKLD